MPLVRCPECDKKISDSARLCPHCGYPIERMNRREKRSELVLSIQKQPIILWTATKPWLLLFTNVVIFVALSSLYFSAPFPDIGSPDRPLYRIYYLDPPLGCNKELAYKKIYNDYDPLAELQGPYGNLHGESFVASGSKQQNDAIRCEIWRDYQNAMRLSRNPRDVKIAMLFAVILDPLVFLPLLGTLLLLSSSSSVTPVIASIAFILAGLVSGSVSYWVLNAQHFFRPNELTVIHFLAVGVYALLISSLFELCRRFRPALDKLRYWRQP